MTIILLTSCWQKQKHSITAPKVPVYKLYGIITDIDSKQELPNLEVTIQPKPGDLLFDWTPPNPMVHSDAKGYYELAVCPGNYTIFLKRNNCIVFQKKITLNFADRKLDIQVPKVLITSVARQFKGIGGICVKDAQTLSLAGKWETDNNLRNRIFEGGFNTQFETLGKKPFSPENPDFHGLAYAGGKYLSFTGTIAKPKIVQINAKTGRIEREETVPHRLSDITFDGENLWATATNSKIYQFNGLSATVLNEYESPGNYPTGVAWDGYNICSFDSSFHYLFIHDKNLKIRQTFGLFCYTNKNEIVPLEAISFLAADGEGHIYAAEKGWIYSFQK